MRVQNIIALSYVPMKADLRNIADNTIKTTSNVSTCFRRNSPISFTLAA